MKKLLFIVLLILGVSPIYAQDEIIDSLNSVLSKSQPDSSRVSTLLELSSQYYRTNAEEAKQLATEAKELAEKSNFKSGLAKAHKAIGMSYYFQNNWIDALVQWKLALETYKSIDDLNGVSNILNNLGAVYFNGGDDEAALDYYLQSLRVAEKAEDSLRTVTALINIGTVYLNKQSSRPLAFEYYQKALPLSIQLGDYDAIGTCAVNMGEFYLNNRNQLDSALYFFEQALDAYQKSATGNVAFAMKSIGKVYARRGDYEKAIQYQTEAFELAQAIEAPLEMAQSLLSLANTYELQGDSKKAITTFNKAKDLSKKIDALYEVQSSYQGLASNFAKMSDFEEAYSYQRLYTEIKDTLYNAEMDKKLQAQSLSYEIEKKEDQITLLQKDQELKATELTKQKAIRNASVAIGVLLLLIVLGLYNRFKFTKRTNRLIEEQRERAESLLLNILPFQTAEELKEKGSATPRYYEKVSILFTDFKGFTAIAEKLTPQELVKELNHCFVAFDMIMDKYELEKIKTIGDAYMCAGGIPTIMENNPIDVVMAALEIRDFMETLKLERVAQGMDFWELRIGIHTGPVIAGVVGKNKFAYDIWGDAVNTASRMESSGIAGQVNISGETYGLIKDYFVCTHRGKIKAKNKGEIDMYIVEGIKENAKLPH